MKAVFNYIAFLQNLSFLKSILRTVYTLKIKQSNKKTTKSYKHKKQKKTSLKELTSVGKQSKRLR